MFVLFQGCKKDIPEPDVIKLQVYQTKIKYANSNEPAILNWYVRSADKGGYFYCSTINNVTDFTGYEFKYSLQLPSDLKGKSIIKDIVVEINQLNGEMYYDIMKREKTAFVNNSIGKFQ